MQAYFLKLFAYDKWANTCLLKIFDDKPAANQRINELLSHLQSTQRIWLDRCQGRTATVERFQYRTQEMIWKDMHACHQDWIEYLESLTPGDFNKTISYTNFQGDHFSTSLMDVITQVTNHATHHRGNIIILMKEEGFAAPNLDYISFVRINAEH